MARRLVADPNDIRNALYGGEMSPEQAEHVRHAMARLGEEEYRLALKNGERRQAQVWKHATLELLENNNPDPARHLLEMRWLPVSFEQFLLDPEYMGRETEESPAYPVIMADMMRINPDVLIGEKPVYEAYLGGGTNVGKSYIMQRSCLYQTYLAMSFQNLPRLYGLGATTMALWTLQSAQKSTAKETLYGPIRRSLENIPFARQHMRWDSRNLTSIRFLDSAVSIIAGAAALNTTIGQLVYGGCIDELSFMSEVANSNRSRDPGKGFWSQAGEVYTNISRRRSSRIITRGYSIGNLCFASSVKYEGDFLERRIEKCIRDKEPNTFWSRRKVYDVKPKGSYAGPRFRVLVGTDRWPTRILHDNEVEGIHYAKGAQVERVPVELRVDFTRDPDNALRDVCGLASAALTPFIGQRNTITNAFTTGLVPLVDEPLVVLAQRGENPMPRVLDDRLPPHDVRALPHHVHVDLSISGDRCGIAIARHDGWTNVPTSDGTTERLPLISVPVSVALQPSTTRNVDFGEVRAWIIAWAHQHAFNIKSISYDGFQSTDSIQILRRMGFRAWNDSVDRTMEPYIELRKALLEGRVGFHEFPLLQDELVRLEYDAKRNKVDHPPTVGGTGAGGVGATPGSKDAADAACGAVWGVTKLAMRGSMGEVVRDAEGRSLAQARRADPERRDPKRAPGNDLRAIAAALEARADVEDDGWKVEADAA